VHPYLRFAAAMARAARAPRIGALDEARIALRVLPQDVEVRRMNNGRYLTLMDIGRFDLSVRAGFTRAIFERRWQPLVRSVTIDFRRSLSLGDRFELATRIVSFDAKYFFIEQRFVRDEVDVAIAWVKAVMRERDASCPPAEVLAAIGHRRPSPSMPHAMRLWAESLDVQRAERHAVGS